MEATLVPDKYVLLKAANIVRERWRQDSYGFDGEKRCALGAIAEAKGIVHLRSNEASFAVLCDAGALRWPEARLALDILHKMQFTKNSLSVWNDTPGRTAEEVAHLFEFAAELC